MMVLVLWTELTLSCYDVCYSIYISNFEDIWYENVRMWKNLFSDTKWSVKYF